MERGRSLRPADKPDLQPKADPMETLRLAIERANDAIRNSRRPMTVVDSRIHGYPTSKPQTFLVRNQDQAIRLYADQFLPGPEAVAVCQDNRTNRCEFTESEFTVLTPHSEPVHYRID